MIKSIFNTVVLTSCLALAGGAIAATPTANTSVSSEQQGMHQWQVLGGKLILITGTYQDILAYKRSLTFYFESKPGEEWMHAPVLDGDNRNALTWFSISQGEQTVADAAVVAGANGVEVVIAETKPRVVAPISVTWYRFTQAGDNDTDGPAYFFKKTSSRNYPANAKLTVEQVLKKEVATKIKK
ncbi:hypothetical protein HH212_14010 [Massilia forsythiae]|uniref:Uncharacterized protein n=1 Tax=Massilia forsythiae TaxID=2728020 RepID=A0A7Z2VXE9_9BURK|nr:hypothetical protein [Massilia forsythiae]QJE01009.1 hypothetical protein HH212_14010 [Massilia forsythiae]